MTIQVIERKEKICVLFSQLSEEKKKSDVHNFTEKSANINAETNDEITGNIRNKIFFSQKLKLDSKIYNLKQNKYTIQCLYSTG